MKKDALREYINKAHEAYDIAATPPVNRIYESPEDIGDRETDALAERRETLLRIGIDIKYIVVDFLGELTENHGSKRAERMKYYLQNGYVEDYSSAHREQIKFDSKILRAKITRYKIDGKII